MEITQGFNSYDDEPEDIDEIETERIQRENSEADMADYYYEDEKLN